MSLKPIVTEGGEHTLVVVRRSVAERKIALAVAIFEFLRARFRAVIAAFRTEAVSSRLVGRWDSISMAGTQSSCVTGRV